MLCYTVDVMLAAAVEVMFDKSVVGGDPLPHLAGCGETSPIVTAAMLF